MGGGLGQSGLWMPLPSPHIYIFIYLGHSFAPLGFSSLSSRGVDPGGVSSSFISFSSLVMGLVIYR